MQLMWIIIFDYLCIQHLKYSSTLFIITVQIFSSLFTSFIAVLMQDSCTFASWIGQEEQPTSLKISSLFFLFSSVLPFLSPCFCPFPSNGSFLLRKKDSATKNVLCFLFFTRCLDRLLWGVSVVYVVQFSSSSFELISSMLFLCATEHIMWSDDYLSWSCSLRLLCAPPPLVFCFIRHLPPFKFGETTNRQCLRLSHTVLLIFALPASCASTVNILFTIRLSAFEKECEKWLRALLVWRGDGGCDRRRTPLLNNCKLPIIYIFLFSSNVKISFFVSAVEPLGDFMIKAKKSGQNCISHTIFKFLRFYSDFECL